LQGISLSIQEIAAGIAPAADTLCVDQIVVDRLHSPIPDIVHPLHPQHLVFRFELFGCG
jgi:hypothetical protein